MKAARLHEIAAPLQIEAIAEPELCPGAVKVRVLASPIPSHTANVMRGQMPFPLPVPYTLGTGAIAIVEAVADDVIGIQPGEQVYCSPYYYVDVNGGAREEILIGFFGMTPQSDRLLRSWKNGTFAEKALFPQQCVTPLTGVDALDPVRLSAINYLNIAYGGLLAGGLRPGQTVLVTGATGYLGSLVVLVALAMGAETVFPVGRNRQQLERLVALSPERVRAVPLQDDPATHAPDIVQVAGQVDLYLDSLGLVSTPELTMAGINAVRLGGTVVFNGGVFATLPVNYLDVLSKRLTIRGNFMFPQQAPADIVRMIASGLISLDTLKVNAFPLEQVNDAIDRAATAKALELYAVTPA